MPALPPTRPSYLRAVAHSRLIVSILILGLIVAVVPRRSAAAATSTATITVTSSATGTLQTQLSTNNVWSGEIDGASGAQQKLNALHDPLVRLHVGDDGSPAAWGDDPKSRPWNAYGAAWWGALFQQVAPLGVQLINQYDVIDAPQFGLIDDQTGATRLPYWEQKVLNGAFPPGSTLLSSSSTASPSTRASSTAGVTASRPS